MAVAVELGEAHACAVVDIPVCAGVGVLQPAFGFDIVEVVVVTEAVALGDAAVGVVEVVLEVERGDGDIAVAEGVDVKPVFGAEEVAYCFIVGGLGVVERQTGLQLEVVVETVVDEGIEHSVELLVHTIFQDVGRSFVVGFILAFVLDVVELIDGVEVLPVDLAEARIVFPQVGVIVGFLLVVIV